MQFGWRGKKVRQPMTRRPVTGGSRQDASDMRLPAPGTHRMEWVLRLTLPASLGFSLHLVGQERLEHLRTAPRDQTRRLDQDGRPGACRRCDVRRSRNDAVGINSVLLVGGSDTTAGANDSCRLQGLPQAARNRERTPRLAGIRATYHHRRPMEQNQDGPRDGRTSRVTCDSTDKKTACLGYTDLRHRPVILSDVKLYSTINITTGRSTTSLARCKEWRSPKQAHFRCCTQDNSKQALLSMRQISLELHSRCTLLPNKIPQSFRKTALLRKSLAGHEILIGTNQSKWNQVGLACASALLTTTE